MSRIAHATHTDYATTALFETADLTASDGFFLHGDWIAAILLDHAHHLRLLPASGTLNDRYPYLNAQHLLNEVVTRRVVSALPPALAGAVRYQGARMNQLRVRPTLCDADDYGALAGGKFGVVVVSVSDVFAAAATVFPYQTPGWVRMYNLMSLDPTVYPSFFAKHHRRRVGALIDSFAATPDELLLAAELLEGYQAEEYGPRRRPLRCRGTVDRLAHDAVATARKAMR
jgi:hypothetical protein